MNILRLISAVIFGALLVQGILLVLLVESATPSIMKVEIRGSIQPSTASYIKRAVSEASKRNSVALLIELNTPGGMLGPTRSIVTSILSSEVPVIVFVTPSGARAGSAGTFIVAASHIAAMSPATNIGAATPVGANGEDLDDTMKSKSSQDAAALLRSISENRGRPTAPLEETVIKSASFTSKEALQAGIIDFIAEDTQMLLEKIDGSEINIGHKAVVLDISDVPVEELRRSFLERFLDAVGNPNITFVLLTLGSIALTLEFVQPGILVGGFVGILAMAVAFVGMGQLPVNWVGVALLTASLVLFFIEAQAPGLGLYITGGILCFLLGAFLLFGGLSPPPINGPSFRVSTWVIGTSGLVLAGSLSLAIKAFAEAASDSSTSHMSGVVGSIGVVEAKLDPTGLVRVQSELWSAETSDSNQKINEGESVIVTKMKGLKIYVSKLSSEQGGDRK